MLMRLQLPMLQITFVLDCTLQCGLRPSYVGGQQSPDERRDWRESYVLLHIPQPAIEWMGHALRGQSGQLTIQE